MLGRSYHLMKPMTINSVVRSDRGLIRKNNEDSVGVLADEGLVVLADGMGGHRGGEVASTLAIESVVRLISIDNKISPAAAIDYANKAILKRSVDEPELKGMATTAVVGLFRDGLIDYAHVGDSRLYLWRDSRLTQLTRDHSMIQEMVDKGFYPSLEEARKDGIRNNLLTRGVGLGRQLEVDSGTLQLSPGDLFLFCSDGLSNMLSDALIGQALMRYAGRLEEAVDRLLGLALRRGGYDNISLALVEPEWKID